ncbi:hypothetical protein [Marinobacterium mangrovicola]|uniref:VacJ n=1 Tax=Marinobacterium mangrovicola TaxID=1476959 RepID=A0A4R1G7L0_9GAMM|nr:hypothetical protein [Marinobacterium mangrovicola]TCK02681.1 hypothetical protein CLV83_4378 [Marinobacterium mangrovicola]
MTIKLLNRSALVVRPKQPLADWAAEQAPEENLDLESLRQEGTVYLIDEAEQESSFADALDEGWRAIFENELAAWDEFGDHWPVLERSLFDQWFEVEPQILAFDLSEQALLRANLE